VNIADLAVLRSVADEERAIRAGLAHRDTIVGDDYAELLAAALATPAGAR